MSYGLAAAVSLGFAMLTFAYLSVNFKDKHAPLKWLFAILSVATAVFSSFTMSAVAGNAEYANVEGIMSWIGYGFTMVLVIMIAYFLIWFMYNSLRKTTQKAYGEGSEP